MSVYDEMGDRELDMIREVASIGTGYAATALAGVLGQKVKMSIPEVHLLGYDESIERLGDPEEGIAAVLTKMSGEIQGIMLFLLRLDFINKVLDKTLNHRIHTYEELSELELSAVTEIGNIIISSYTNALSMLVDTSIELSVPCVAVNMLGGILSVPIAEFGYATDKLLLIDGRLIVDHHKLDSTILMMPNMDSFNILMEKLGASYETRD